MRSHSKKSPARAWENAHSRGSLLAGAGLPLILAPSPRELSPKVTEGVLLVILQTPSVTLPRASLGQRATSLMEGGKEKTVALLRRGGQEIRLSTKKSPARAWENAHSRGSILAGAGLPLILAPSPRELSPKVTEGVLLVILQTPSVTLPRASLGQRATSLMEGGKEKTVALLRRGGQEIRLSTKKSPARK